MCPWKAAKVTKPTLSLESEAARCCRLGSKPISRHLRKHTRIVCNAVDYDNY